MCESVFWLWLHMKRLHFNQITEMHIIDPPNQSEKQQNQKTNIVSSSIVWICVLVMVTHENASFQTNYKNAHNWPSQSIRKTTKPKKNIVSSSMVWICVLVMMTNEKASFQPNYKNAHNWPSQPIKKTTKPKKNK